MWGSFYIIRYPSVFDKVCLLYTSGSTPIGLYKNLIAAYENGNLDFSKVHSINLDEYKGLSGDNDQSYRYFMNHNLFDYVNIDKANTNVPNGLEPDSDKACEAYNCLLYTSWIWKKGSADTLPVPSL